MENIERGVFVSCPMGIAPALQSTKNKKTEIISGRSCFYPIGKWKFEKNEEPQKGSEVIFFFKADQKVCNSLKKEELRKKSDYSETELHRLASKILNSIKGLSVNNLRSCEVRIFPSRKLSTAYNPKFKNYVGLHIDTHDNIDNMTRKSAWDLISVNMGKSNRYFNYIDITFDKIVALLKLNDLTELNSNQIPMHEIVKLFFNKFPEYPVHRMIIPPSFGYMARSQFLVHDGSTNWNGDDDVSVLISGNFKFA